MEELENWTYNDFLTYLLILGANADLNITKDEEDEIVYKMGEEGSFTITPEDEFQTGIYPVEALKPTGAGDSFMGGFIASLANGYSLKDAVLRGSACASIVVSRVGCAPAMPTPAELADFLTSHSGPTV